MNTCVLMGGVGAQAGMWERSKDPEIVELRKGYPAEKRTAYLSVYTQLDGIRYVPTAAPVALYFQFARFERYFDDQSMNAYFAAASEPVSAMTTGHDGDPTRPIRQANVNWARAFFEAGAA